MVTLATVAGLSATAFPGPDLDSLWNAYVRAAQQATGAWETAGEARQAGGTVSSGEFFGSAYALQAAADEAYATWVTAQKQVAGVRG